MKKSISLALLATVILFVSIPYENLAFATDNSVTFSVGPKENHVWKEGDIFTVDIIVSDIQASQHIIGAEFRLGFNSTLLQVIDVKEGPFFRQFSQTPTRPSTFFDYFVETRGSWGPHIVFGMMLLPNATGLWPEPMPQGSGTMAQVTFKAAYQSVEPEPSGHCVLHLFNATVIDDSANHLAVETEDGQYDIPRLLYPISSFTYTSDESTKGLSTIFNATNSYDPDGTIAYYYWSFGDGSTYNTSQQVATHVYNVEGTFDVALTVWDTDGLSATSAGNVSIIPYREITVNIDTGPMHFAGEIADFYILVSHVGKPITPTSLEAHLYCDGHLYSDLTSDVQWVSPGLYRISYQIPSDARPTTYTLVANAQYYSIEGSNLKGFTISSTLSGFVTDVNQGIGTVTNDVGQMKVNLTAINAALVGVNGNIGVINTTLGLLTVKLDTIKATVTSVDGNVATISTTLGEVKTTVGDNRSNVTQYTVPVLLVILVIIAAILVFVIVVLNKKTPSLS